ncbi:MAG TPA: thiamine pyrophosphate-binding protein [Casimicrobiaceae bacterium]|nr:thiamine pyrophosphate-binding protein [Casimicrobiaceae bacterium]
MRIEAPAALDQSAARFGSDAVAQTLRALEVPYIALNPGASYRGLHDSLVNYLGNERPQMLLCLHEESAVAIAHGYAKATGKPLFVALHSNVGLMHATMAIFNAWCDRMPVIVLGATGPLDAVRRRPWIDWIHTARDQGALVRDYVKWDDQPASPGAAREALLRAAWLAQTAPCAPVYVNLDAHLQEAPLDAPLPPIDVARYRPDATPSPAANALDAAARVLDGAMRPLILAGRVSRDAQAWQARVALAEKLGARVLTDLKVGAAFPTDHPLHAAAPCVLTSGEMAHEIAQSDVILSLDWVDLAGTLNVAFKGEARAKVIQVSLDHTLHNGWSMDHQGLPPIDVMLAADPDAVTPLLLERVAAQARSTSPPVAPHEPYRLPGDDAKPDTEALAHVLREVVGARTVSFSHLPLSWNGASWPFRHPLDFLGSDGGGGIGAGPGIAVGAALALRGSDRLPIAVCGDGDYLMGVTALWTATHYRIPLLLIVANNNSFYNDEVHQERVARMRDRAVENKWIGQRIDDPAIDLARMADAQGALGLGPITRVGDLRDAFTRGIAAVDEGNVAVIDVRIQAGYTPAMSASPTPGKTR